jgi:hypothetical protein
LKVIKDLRYIILRMEETDMWQQRIILDNLWRKFKVWVFFFFFFFFIYDLFSLWGISI